MKIELDIMIQLKCLTVLFVLCCSLLTCYSCSQPTIECDKRGFLQELISNMTTVSADSVYITIPNCVTANSKVLQQITEISPDTNKSHWGEHYTSISNLQSDSLAYSLKINHMTNAELDSVIVKNCSEIKKLLSKNCLFDLDMRKYDCFFTELAQCAGEAK